MKERTRLIAVLEDWVFPIGLLIAAVLVIKFVSAA